MNIFQQSANGIKSNERHANDVWRAQHDLPSSLVQTLQGSKPDRQGDTIGYAYDHLIALGYDASTARDAVSDAASRAGVNWPISE